MSATPVTELLSSRIIMAGYARDALASLEQNSKIGRNLMILRDEAVSTTSLPQHFLVYTLEYDTLSSLQPVRNNILRKDLRLVNMTVRQNREAVFVQMNGK